MKTLHLFWRGVVKNATLILSVIGLGALLELTVEVGVGRILASPTFGPMRFRGQPIETIAGAWFLAIVALDWVALRSHEAIQSRFRGYRFLLSTVGLGIVVWAIMSQAKSLPVQYWVAGGCGVGIFLDSVLTTTVEFSSTMRFAWSDFTYFSRRAVTWLATCAGLALVTWGPQTAATESVRGGREFQEWFQRQPRVPLPVPIDNPGVVIVEFIDYQCPFSLEAETRYKSLFAELRAESAGRVRFVRLDFPLNTACNSTPGMRNVHAAACEAAAAVRIARAAGEESRMAGWLWSNQTTLSRDSIFRELETQFNITDAQERYPALLDLIRNDSTIGQRLSITRTPTFWINGVLLSGISAQSFRWAVHHEMLAHGS